MREIDLLILKLGPMDLGTSPGLGAIGNQPWDQFLIPPLTVAGLSRPKMEVLHSEKVTFTGSYPLNGHKWQL